MVCEVVERVVETVCESVTCVYEVALTVVEAWFMVFDGFVVVDEVSAVMRGLVEFSVGVMDAIQTLVVKFEWIGGIVDMIMGIVE